MCNATSLRRPNEADCASTPCVASFEAVFSILRTGCAWRSLPRKYGPWQTVYWYFRGWRLDGTWVRIHAQLRALTRLHAGRDPTPSTAIIDIQSVKTLM